MRVEAKTLANLKKALQPYYTITSLPGMGPARRAVMAKTKTSVLRAVPGVRYMMDDLGGCYQVRVDHKAGEAHRGPNGWAAIFEISYDHERREPYPNNGPLSA